MLIFSISFQFESMCCQSEHSTLMFLTWHDPISCVLLVANMLLLLAVAGMAGLFAWHLDTLVVRSVAFYLSVLPDNPQLPTGLQVFCQGIHLLPCLGPKLRGWPVCSDLLSGSAVYLSNLACGVDALPTGNTSTFLSWRCLIAQSSARWALCCLSPTMTASPSASLPAAMWARTWQRTTRPHVSPSACSSTLCPRLPYLPLPMSTRAITCWLSTCWPH